MASNDNDLACEGYIFEPEKADYQYLVQHSSDSDTSDDMNAELGSNTREGRTKMSVGAWCRCGHCTRQKTDDECYCCKEHELLSGRMDGLQCFTAKSDLQDYVAHRPSLEMAFIDAMIKKHVRGPAPDQLSNRQVYVGGATS